MDMGLGKTVTTLTAVQDLIEAGDVKRALVIAPLRVARYTWPDEIAQWDHLNIDYSLLLGTPKKRKEGMASDAPLHIINVENLVWLITECGKNWPYDMVIIDESSLFKSYNSKRFKKLKTKLPEIDRVVLLTGTPAPNSLMDLWPQVFLMDKGERLGRTFSGFRSHYFNSDYMGYTWTPEPWAADMIHGKIEDLCIRLDANDYLDMPEKIERRIPVHIPHKQQEQYDEFEREWLMPLAGEETLVAQSAGVLAGKLLQFANGAMYNEAGGFEVFHDEKIKAAEDIVHTSAGQPVLLAYNFQSDRDRLQKAFPEAVMLSEDGAIDAWNAGDVPILLTHPASGGHGLNLQHGGRIIVWFGLPWSLEHYQQLNARLYRQGQKDSVVIHHLVSQGTIDEDVMKALGRKDATQGALLNALRARANKWT